MKIGVFYKTWLLCCVIVCALASSIMAEIQNYHYLAPPTSFRGLVPKKGQLRMERVKNQHGILNHIATFEFDPRDMSVVPSVQENMNNRLYMEQTNFLESFVVDDNGEKVFPFAAGRNLSYAALTDTLHDMGIPSLTFSDHIRRATVSHEDVEPVVSVPYGNIFNNTYFVAYIRGKLNHRYCEPFSDREYSCFVSRQDGTVGIENLKFSSNGHPTKEGIETAFFGQHILKDGNVNLSAVSHQFSDLGQLFVFPKYPFREPADPQVPDRFFGFGRPEMISDADQKLSANRWNESLVCKALSEAVEIPIQSDLDTSQIDEKFGQAGYRRVDYGAVREPGDFAVSPDERTIKIRYRRAVYLHNLIGIVKDAAGNVQRVVSMVISTEQDNADKPHGVTIEQAAELMRREGCSEALLLANGTDERMYHKGTMVVEPILKGHQKNPREEMFGTILFVPKAEGPAPDREQIEMALAMLEKKDPRTAGILRERLDLMDPRDEDARRWLMENISWFFHNDSPYRKLEAAPEGRPVEQPRVSFVLLHHRSSPGCMVRALQNLARTDYDNFDIIVVNNDSPGKFSEHFAELSRQIPARILNRVHLISNKVNLGYCGGNNQAARAALRNDSEYVFFLNDDAMLEADGLKKMIAAVRDRPEIGAVQPSLYLYPDEGSIEPLIQTGQLSAGVRASAQKDTDTSVHQTVQAGDATPVEGTSNLYYREPTMLGTAQLVRADVLRLCGGWDSRFLAYVDEDDIGYRYAMTGFKKAMISDVFVVHPQFGKDSLNIARTYFNCRNGLFMAEQYYNHSELGRSIVQRPHYNWHINLFNAPEDEVRRVLSRDIGSSYDAQFICLFKGLCDGMMGHLAPVLKEAAPRKTDEELTQAYAESFLDPAITQSGRDLIWRIFRETDPHRIRLMIFALDRVAGRLQLEEPLDTATQERLRDVLFESFVAWRNWARSPQRDPRQLADIRRNIFEKTRGVCFPVVIDVFPPTDIDVSVVAREDLAGHVLVDRSGRQPPMVNCVPAGADDIRMDLVEATRSIREDRTNQSTQVTSLGNFLFNDWFIIYDGLKRRILCRQGEPVLQRYYTMLVVWDDGHITSENVQFTWDEQQHCHLPHIEGKSPQEVLAIKTAFFGQRIIHEGNKTPWEQLYNQFDDLWHLFYFPQMGVFTQYDSARLADVLGWCELFDHLPDAEHPVDRRRLLDVLRADGYMEFDLSPYLARYSLADLERFAFKPRGYKLKLEEGELHEGEYRLIGNKMCVKLVKGRYPHALAGLTQNGRLVTIQFTGDGERAQETGYTIDDLRNRILEENRRRPDDPIREVFLLAAIQDVAKITDGRLLSRDSAYRARTNHSAGLVIGLKHSAPSRRDPSEGPRTGKMMEESL